MLLGMDWATKKVLFRTAMLNVVSHNRRVNLSMYYFRLDWW